MFGWFKYILGDLPVSGVRDVHTVCLHFPDGFRDQELNALKSALALADVHNLIQPNSIKLYFAATSGVDKQLEKVRGVLNALNTREDLLRFSIGESRGRCLGEFNSNGTLNNVPIGDPVNRAIKMASQSFQLSSAA